MEVLLKICNVLDRELNDIVEIKKENKQYATNN